MSLPLQAQKEMVTRLRRIEGQARGVQRMLAEDRDCLEILTQLAALRSATYSASVSLAQHFATQCIHQAREEDSAAETLQNLVTVLLRTPH
jgi:DNA-binding FrmR family transcriptional regulator